MGHPPQGLGCFGLVWFGGEFLSLSNRAWGELGVWFWWAFGFVLIAGAGWGLLGRGLSLARCWRGFLGGCRRR